MVQTPLHVAAGYNNVEILKFLLGWPGPEKVELEAKNMVREGIYQLHTVAFSFGADWTLSLVTSCFLLFCLLVLIFCALQYGETPLHMAAKNGCNEATKVLLAHGAHVEAKANVCIFTASIVIGLGACVSQSVLIFIFMWLFAEWDDSVAPCCLAFTTSRRLFNSKDIVGV